MAAELVAARSKSPRELPSAGAPSERHPLQSLSGTIRVDEPVSSCSTKGRGGVPRPPELAKRACDRCVLANDQMPSGESPPTPSAAEAAAAESSSGDEKGGLAHLATDVSSAAGALKDGFSTFAQDSGVAGAAPKLMKKVGSLVP